MTQNSSAIFQGTIPALMTPCTAARKPDFDALVRSGKRLADAGTRELAAEHRPAVDHHVDLVRAEFDRTAHVFELDGQR